MNKYKIIKPNDRTDERWLGYYTNQYYCPNHEDADKLGYVHFETAEGMGDFIIDHKGLKRRPWFDVFNLFEKLQGGRK
ncbi:MAG: hypothetical protein NUV65_03580 [Candidatus Roizmanbacteria bacterium]|nr:hypothetical protein [Candidatus Roizmanbacteria bacterium]